MSLIDELISVLGKRHDSPEVSQVLSRNELLDIFDSTPDRQVSSKKKGVSVAFDSDVAVNVMIFVRPIPHADPLRASMPFSGSLPFGIEKDMSQEEVHRALGEPVRFENGTASFYLVCDRSLILTVRYGAKSGRVTKISISTQSLRDDVNGLLVRR